MANIAEQMVVELSSRNIYPFAPLGVNFAINLVWGVVKNYLKASRDYRLAQGFGETPESKNTNVFLIVNLILYLFSFFTTFIIFLSLDFLLKIKAVEYLRFMWWLPSVITIVLAEIAKLISIITRDSEVNNPGLEGKMKQFGYFFWTVISSLAIFWGYIFFGDIKEIFSLFSDLPMFFQKL